MNIWPGAAARSGEEPYTDTERESLKIVHFISKYEIINR